MFIYSSLVHQSVVKLGKEMNNKQQMKQNLKNLTKPTEEKK